MIQKYIKEYTWASIIHIKYILHIGNGCDFAVENNFMNGLVIVFELPREGEMSGIQQ